MIVIVIGIGIGSEVIEATVTEEIGEIAEIAVRTGVEVGVMKTLAVAKVDRMPVNWIQTATSRAARASCVALTVEGEGNCLATMATALGEEAMIASTLAATGVTGFSMTHTVDSDSLHGTACHSIAV